MLQLAVSGLPLGGMYALAALGIVLIYRTTGTLTLAQGGIATASAFTFHALWADVGLPFPIAIVGALAVAAIIGWILELIMRVIGQGQVLAQVIATLGVSGILLYTYGQVFGAETRFVDSFFPAGTVTIAGVALNWTQVAVIVIAGVLAGGLALGLGRTRLGTAARAVSQNRLAAQLAGIDVGRVETASWITGSVLAGVAGILLAPLLFLDTVQLALFFVVKPFAAAVVGGLTGLGMAFAGGLVLGVVEGVVSQYSFVPGLTETVPFVMIIVALLVRQRISADTTKPLVREPTVRPGNGALWPGLVVLAVALLAIPLLSTADVTTLKTSAIFALVALSLVVLTGWVGQVSLAQMALVGIGGFMAAALATRVGLPFPLVLIAAPLLVVPFALAIGIPALRFRGLLLAVVTLAFGSLAFYSLFQWDAFTGGTDGRRLPPPDAFGIDLAAGDRYAYLVVAVTAVVFLAVRNLARYRIGGALLSIRESEDGAASLAIGVMSRKLVAFALSGAIAGLAGVLLAYDVQTVSFEQYSPFASFSVFALAVFAGIESLAGALLAGLLFAAAPVVFEFLPLQIDDQIVSSVGVVLTLMLLPGGLVQLGRKLGTSTLRPALAQLAALVRWSR